MPKNETTQEFLEQQNREKQLRVKMKIAEAQSQAFSQASALGDGGGPALPQSFIGTPEVLESRNQLVAEMRNTTDVGPSFRPNLVAAGKVLSDTGRNVQTLFLKGLEFLASPGPTGAGSPEVAEFANNQIAKVNKDAPGNQELFNILADRKPGVGRMEFVTAGGITLAVPGRREKAVAEGVARLGEKTGSLLRGRRVATAGSEAVAGGVFTVTQPIDVDALGLATALGTAIGSTVFRIMNGLTRAGRMFIGGKPATLQRIDDLKQAESDLGATGLLTTGELRGGRIMQRIESVYDNMPVPLLSLAGKRDSQMIDYGNAVRRIQAAFPEITEAEAKKLITKRLNQHITRVNKIYDEIDAAAAGTPSFVQVRPDHYVKRAENFLVAELNKGAAANSAVIKELEQIITQGPVTFKAATEIAGDLGTKIRKAERGATDPAATGIDAGRMKQLSMAFYRDLETWANQFPPQSQVFTRWQQAKSIYKQNILPFNKRPLAPLFDADGADSYALTKALLDPAKGGQLTKLDEDGALAALYIGNAVEESTRAGNVDVRLLARFMDKPRNRKAFGSLVDGVPDESVAMVRALVKIVDANPGAFKSAGDALRTTAGSAAVVAAAGGVGFFAGSTQDQGGGGLALGLMSLGLMRWAIGTPSGRAFLTSASRVKPENREALRQIGSRMNIGYLRWLETSAIGAGQTIDEAAAERGLPEPFSAAGLRP